MTTGRLYRAPRRWPAMVGVAAAGALVGGGIGAGAMTLTTDRTSSTSTTVTVNASPSATAQAQPTDRADRQTCGGWDASGKLINEAADALSVIPEGTSILDPSVRDDTERVAAVQHSSELFLKAGDALRQAITPGATDILTQTSLTAVASLVALSTAYRDFDESSGDAIATARSAAHSMSELCKRLVH
ncbi:MAG: hypothetical protein H6523_15005 [Mycolicibacterium sp.]|nr:hypothetical protein [Mycolicibacterium sp.]